MTVRILSQMSQLTRGDPVSARAGLVARGRRRGCVVAAAVLGAGAGSAQPGSGAGCPAFLAFPGALLAGGPAGQPARLADARCRSMFAGLRVRHPVGRRRPRGRRRVGDLVRRPRLRLPRALRARRPAAAARRRLPSPRWRPIAVGRPRRADCCWSRVVPGRGTRGRGRHDALAARSANPIGVLPATGAGPSSTLDWVLQLPLLLGMAAVAVRLRRPRTPTSAAGWSSAGCGRGVRHASWWSAGRCGRRAADVLDVAGSALLAAALTSADPSPPPARNGRGRAPRVRVRRADRADRAGLRRCGGGRRRTPRRRTCRRTASAWSPAAIALSLLPLRGLLQRLLDRAMYGEARSRVPPSAGWPRPWGTRPASTEW